MTSQTPAGTDVRRAQWRKSSRSHGQSDCVEVAFAADGSVLVRDSKSRTAGPPLAIAQQNWRKALTMFRQ